MTRPCTVADDPRLHGCRVCERESGIIFCPTQPLAVLFVSRSRCKSQGEQRSAEPLAETAVCRWYVPWLLLGPMRLVFRTVMFGLDKLRNLLARLSLSQSPSLPPGLTIYVILTSTGRGVSVITPLCGCVDFLDVRVSTRRIRAKRKRII